MNQRVRITSPQTRLALRRKTDAMRRVNHKAGRPPIASTAIDMAGAERALRRQRRLALRTALLLGAVLGALLLASALVSGLLGWAVLFFAPYPLLLALAAGHVRRAEQIEADS
ncbi:hypothetical protein [Glycomyces xiaoerkulensis]|uniref:hypothetical protein n=1 Tax=Glycomyces xiaoerkulensis TaxID=2038139 RepID=UPI000C259376|nr:hypothetical protein [Glycomyces xiaoerkulensis]